MLDKLLNLIRRGGPRAVTPDTPEEVRRELATDAEFHEQARKLAQVQQEKMIRDVAQTGAENAFIQHQAINGLGEKVAQLPMEVFFHMRALYGDQCWEDPQFMREFLRDNPGCRVKVVRGTRGQEYAGKHPTSNIQHPTSNRGEHRTSNGGMKILAANNIVKQTT